MSRRRRSSNPMGLLPLLIPAITGATALITGASSYFGEKAKTKSYQDSVAAAAVAAKKEQVNQEIQLSTIRKQQNLDSSLQASQDARNEQIMGIAAIAGIAVGVAGLFLIMGFKGVKK